MRRCEKAAWGSRGGRCPGNLAALLVRCLPTTCRLVDVLRGSCSPSEQEWARTVVQRGLCGLGKASAHPLLEARGVQGRVEGPGGQGPLPALPALASARCLGAWVPGAARIAVFPQGRGRGCPGRLAVSTELASASWGWLGELVPSTRSCLQRPVPQAICVLLREPQKLLERWAWPGAIFPAAVSLGGLPGTTQDCQARPAQTRALSTLGGKDRRLHGVLGSSAGVTEL